jgi:GT2 family glycosyltransferase
MEAQPLAEAESAPLVSVVIVSYQSAATLERCLDAVAAQSFTDFEVLLIDNASPDGAGAGEAGRRPRIRFFPQTENLGFAAANNLAARAARGRWLALLNPDAFAKPDWLAQLIAGAGRHPSVRCFGSLQLNAENEEIMDGAGDVMTIAGIPYRGGYGLKRRPIPEGEIFSACAAAMLIDRALFLQHGGFDERFFCYCEDVDLGYRLRLAGERVMILPDAVVAHVGGGSSGPRSKFATYHGARNRVWTYVKNTPPLLFWLTLPLHVAITLMLVVLATRRGLSRVTWCGALAGVEQAGAMRRQSRARSISVARVTAKNPVAFIGRTVIVMRP